MGLLPDASALYVTNWCNATTYRYDISGPAPVLTTTLRNGLTNGLTLVDGVYYGVASNNQNVLDSGVYSFSPTTLQVTGQVIGNPCGSAIRGLAALPGDSALFLTGDCGLFRVDNPASAVPSFAKIADGDFDSITLDPATHAAWISDNTHGTVTEIDTTTGARLRFFDRVRGAGGVAVVRRDASQEPAGDLVVNTNDGTMLGIGLSSGRRTVLAKGGSRGTFVAVDENGALYATQTDHIERFGPGPFLPTSPSRTTVSTYVALGDSFASGEGAEESQFVLGTTVADPKVAGSTTGCHRSWTSWAQQTRNNLILDGTINRWRFVACSGAVVDNLYATNRTYESVGQRQPAQLDAVDRTTTVATLSIGGNDANFAKLIKHCAGNVATNRNVRGCRRAGSGADTLAKQGLDYLRNGIPVPSLGTGVKKTLAQVYVDIAMKMADNGRLVVAGYPSLFATSRLGYDALSSCKIGTAAGGLEVRVQYSDAQWLNRLADQANEQIETSVARANATLAGRKSVTIVFAPVNAAFTNHRLCSGDRYINGVELTSVRHGKPQPKQVSVHPNRKGQEQYASVVIPRVRA